MMPPYRTVGSGQLTKMVNQAIVAITVQGVSEGLAFAQKAGLDIPKVMETDLQRLRPSPGRWRTAGRPMNEASSTSASPSTGCARTSASSSMRPSVTGAKMEVAALIDTYYADVQKMGGGRWDTSGLIARLNKK
jgi:3-hydroxyisobutyrate dehydrogenase